MNNSRPTQSLDFVNKISKEAPRISIRLDTTEPVY